MLVSGLAAILGLLFTGAAIVSAKKALSSKNTKARLASILEFLAFLGFAWLCFRLLVP